MSDRNVLKNKWTWIIGIPVLLVALVVGGTWVYINVIDDPPAKLKLSTVQTKPGSASTTPTDASIDGTWNVISDVKALTLDRWNLWCVMCASRSSGIGPE